LFLPINRIFFFKKIAIFLTDTHNDTIFVLKGYAGTGKTTVISTIVNNLLDINKKYVLLAPTGRAKSDCYYSNKPALRFTKNLFPKDLLAVGFFYFATK
jgi:ABC-type proline/glycine betaine transport system ATPase subunit